LSKVVAGQVSLGAMAARPATQTTAEAAWRNCCHTLSSKGHIMAAQKR
jgi:hypothetical protein